jgi:hypothetical protein
MRRKGCAVVRQGHLIAVMGAFLIGCAVLALHSRGAVAQEDRCEGTRSFRVDYKTNDVPGCPKGGLLSGADRPVGDKDSGIRGLVIDKLAGNEGNDEIRGLGGSDELYGGAGSDVIYGGPGGDFMYGTGTNTYSDFGRETDKDVYYGGDGSDTIYGGKGEDVIYGGDGDDYIVAAPFNVDFGPNKQQDKLYCGAGRDTYYAGPLDYVDSSCEEGELVDTGGTPLIPLAGVALLSTGLMMSRYVIRRIS